MKNIFLIPFFLVSFLSLLQLSHAASNECTQKTACQPWEISKPCSINKRIDLRLGIRSASHNMLAFGFCPIVDELQAFNISGMGALLSTLQGSNASFIVYGQGNAINPTEDTSNAILYAETNDKCKTGEVAVVNFLLLRISMTKGLYTYLSNTSYPDNSGFDSTCDKYDKCLYSPESICIGSNSNRNCAKCYSSELLKSAQTTVWASYYGTDVKSKYFKSGESNPAQFQRFSIGALESMSRAFG